MTDWLKTPKTDVPLVFGPPQTTLGYYAMEESARGSGFETLSQHGYEVGLWYRALTIHLELQRGNWTPLQHDGTRDARRAQSAQIDLLALSLCSSKAALDMTLASYYSIAWASIRHCLEIGIHCQYLAHFPTTSEFWYESENRESDPPRCRQMVDQIKKHYKPSSSNPNQGYSDLLESTYQSWRLMSAGSHPTGQGLTQLQDPDEHGSRYWGSNYRYDLAMVSFDNGLFALSMILNCYTLVRTMEESMSQAFSQWKDDVHAWRNELRQNKRVAHLSSALAPNR